MNRSTQDGLAEREMKKLTEQNNWFKPEALAEDEPDIPLRSNKEDKAE